MDFLHSILHVCKLLFGKKERNKDTHANKLDIRFDKIFSFTYEMVFILLTHSLPSCVCVSVTEFIKHTLLLVFFVAVARIDVVH